MQVSRLIVKRTLEFRGQSPLKQLEQNSSAHAIKPPKRPDEIKQADSRVTCMYIVCCNWRLKLFFQNMQHGWVVSRQKWLGRLEPEQSFTHVFQGIITPHSILFTHPVSAQQPNVMGLLSKLKLPGACSHGVMDFFFLMSLLGKLLLCKERRGNCRRERKKLSHSTEIAQLPLWEYTQPMYSRKCEVKAKIDHMCRHIGTVSELRLYTKLYATMIFTKRDNPEDLL